MKRKRYLTNDEVKSQHVPAYKNLTLEKILANVCSRGRIDLYLPDEPDIRKVPKQWVVNVCTGVLGDDFKDWVHEQVEERNALMADRKEVMIAMDPAMAAKLAASTHVSHKYATVIIFFSHSFNLRNERRLSQYVEDHK